MYGPLWRLLPGHWTLKLLQVVALVALVVVVCFVWLFPAIAPRLPFNDNTVGSHSAQLVQRVRPGSAQEV